jgi:hypothetical protein
MKTIANNQIADASLRQVLECASPLALFGYGLAMLKRQRAGAVQDAGAHASPSPYFAINARCNIPSPLGGERVRVRGAAWREKMAA